MKILLLFTLVAAVFLGALTGSIANKIFDKKEGVTKGTSNN